MLRAGADKVSLNTAAIRRPQFIREAARRFGSSTVVVSIEAVRKQDGWYEAYTDNGREKTGLDATNWALQAAELGAGEILVTSVDREGTGSGIDLELTRQISESVDLPVIACGGVGTMLDVLEAVTEGQAQAVSIASMLHYSSIRNQPISRDSFAEDINTDFLFSGRQFARIEDATLLEIKEYLRSQGVESGRATRATTQTC